MTGVQLQTEPKAQGVFRMQRIEDGAWDTRAGHENSFYFVTTANMTTNSRLWKMIFDDITNPGAGGTIEILLNGAEGYRMADNICFDRAGNVIIQEDAGGNDRLGKVWQYDTATGALTEIAAHDAYRFLPGGSSFLTNDEESSGVIDAEEVLGPGYLLLDVQAHYNIGDTELAEDGRLLALFNPDTFWIRTADHNQDGAVNTLDVLSFLNAWNARRPETDYNRDGSINTSDVSAYLNDWAVSRD